MFLEMAEPGEPAARPEEVLMFRSFTIDIAEILAVGKAAIERSGCAEDAAIFC